MRGWRSLVAPVPPGQWWARCPWGWKRCAKHVDAAWGRDGMGWDGPGRAGPGPWPAPQQRADGKDSPLFSPDKLQKVFFCTYSGCWSLILFDTLHLSWLYSSSPWNIILKGSISDYCTNNRLEKTYFTSLCPHISLVIEKDLAGFIGLYVHSYFGFYTLHLVCWISVERFSGEKNK